MKKVYINDFGLCSSYAPNLDLHVRKIQNNDFYQNKKLYKKIVSDDEYLYYYYDSINNLDSLLNQINNLPNNTTLFIGSSSLGIEENEKNYPKKGFSVLGQDLFIAKIIQKLNIYGQHFIFNTACTSSANALLYATRMIEAGVIENALVLGIETKNTLSTFGFLSLGLLSKTSIKPFDKNRDGIILGESFGFIYLSSKKSKWKMAGGESINDISSSTSPSLDGFALSHVIKKILKDTKISLNTINLIKLHATASYANDISEDKSIQNVFKNIPACVALKGYIGHTLGACGVCELSLLLGCLDKNFIPKSIGFEDKDDSLSIMPTIKNELWKNGEFILLNHIAFGGNTTSLLVQKV